MRTPRIITNHRERLELDDGDFLDLDWRRDGRGKLAILSHGLEGSSQAGYIQSMAAALWREGWDILAWNCRSCSGEINRLARFYHSGSSDDLMRVINHATDSHPARRVDLIGFSLGGNITLKLLGEYGNAPPPQLHRAVAFSVPCDLAGSSRRLESFINRKLYMRRFIRPLLEKVAAKRARFPDMPATDARMIPETFKQFDDLYTAPLHGFRDAQDYWQRSSSRAFLSGIKLPTLLVQASNDPFLSASCYPHEEARQSTHFHLEITNGGGHIGFGSPWQTTTWPATRALEFFE